MIKLQNVGKIYNTDGNVAVGIRKVNLELHVGEFVAITGESGSGKTTLLNVISGIDSYEEGEMYVNGEETSYFSTEDLESYRNRYVGFIFQNYNIIDSYSVLKNVECALMYVGYDKKKRRERAKELIEKVGLSHHLKMKASKLSGGEKQRLVIARALAKDAPIIAADEPTGNLDSQSSKEIIELLYEVSKDKLVLIVTHDFNEVEEYATRVIRVYDSEIKEDRELKKVEKKDLSAVSEKEAKASFGDIIKGSTYDLFASPRRFIFNMIVLLFMCVAVLFSVALYKSIQQDSNYSTGYINTGFYNKDASRIVVIKESGEAFSSNEISELMNSGKYSYIATKDSILDESMYWNIESSEYYYYSGFGFYNTASILTENDLEAGRLPSKNSEIVVEIYSNEFIRDDLNSFESFIGQTVRGGYDEYSIVGVINGDKLPAKHTQYVYFYNDELNRLAFNHYTTSLYIEVSYTEGYLDKYNVAEIFEGKELTGNEISFYNINSSENIKSISITDGKNTIIQEVQVKNIENIDYFYGRIYVSTDVYNILLGEFNNPRQISLFVNNVYNVEKISTDLRKDGYIVVVPSLIKQKNVPNLDIFSLIIYFILVVQFLGVTFVIVYATLSHSVKSRRGDVEILRTIGATKGNIRTMFIFEYGLIGTFSFVLALIALFVVYKISTGDLLKAIQSLELLDFAVMYVIVLGLSYLLSISFTKLVFKKSVKKGLDSK